MGENETLRFRLFVAEAHAKLALALLEMPSDALVLAHDAIAELENTERGWHAHGTECDPEWPAEYMESGNLQALKARIAAMVPR